MCVCARVRCMCRSAMHPPSLVRVVCVRVSVCVQEKNRERVCVCVCARVYCIGVYQLAYILTTPNSFFPHLSFVWCVCV